MLFNARRAALLLVLLVPVLAGATTVHACPRTGTLHPAHHRTVRASSSHRLLATRRRRKRGSRDLDGSPDGAIRPQIACPAEPRGPIGRFSDAGLRGLIRPVTPAEDKARRRQLVARNMRAAREARGYSQQALADILGIDRRRILRWEGAYQEPRDYLARIADALGITIADLYAEREPAER